MLLSTSYALNQKQTRVPLPSAMTITLGKEAHLGIGKGLLPSVIVLALNKEVPFVESHTRQRVWRAFLRFAGKVVCSSSESEIDSIMLWNLENH
jgi:hypothetical protein